MANNKIKFGLKNCKYAIATETFDAETGKWTTTYSAPKGIPGSVSISLSKEVASNIFYADDMAYFKTEQNNGYTGSYEFADVPAYIYEEIFGQTRDKNGLLVESAEDQSKYVALMFEIDGDVKATKYCLFRVSLQKPSIEASTKGENVEPKTASCDLSVLPRLDDSKVLCKADADTTSAAYEAFYNAVPTLDFTA